ncbi:MULTISPECIES: response regulator transcription factor [unclassified Paenibacillus]|uniref:winged helix-turn-helix domain-containing protein n=1 Tax=unclassified Paenibacillus TaxID=185978 RepID=UPI001F19D56E|nr:response regulator transcription factor [Paenibacillus sp. JJ-223]CAH1190876.1 Transcriptional regulatory protein CusR [Paenibacillus sp. JJ-223]
MKTTILLVGAQEQTRSLKEALSAEGYAVLLASAGTYKQQLEMVKQNLSMIIWTAAPEDTIQPDEGLKWHRGQNHHNIPFIIITTAISADRIVEWLDSGANDILEQESEPSILMARIRNLLRLFSQGSQFDEEVIMVHDLKINLRSRRVSRAGEYLTLTPKEYELLEFLARHANEACSRKAILSEVWGYDFQMDTNVVDVYIKHLREKVDKGRGVKLIQTVRGVGYMLHSSH